MDHRSEMFFTIPTSRVIYTAKTSDVFGLGHKQFWNLVHVIIDVFK